MESNTCSTIEASPSDSGVSLPDVSLPDASPPNVSVSELDTPELEMALTTLAGHLNAATCRFLVLLGEFDARSGWAVGGVRSCAHWLSWRCSLDAGTAREHLRVARALRDLPLLRAAFGAGQLSYSKVRALTRVATAARELELVELALVTPAGPLERYLRGVAQSLDADDEARRHAARKVTWRWDADGSLLLTARLSPDDGAIVVDALETARDLLAADEAGAPPLDEPPDPSRGPYNDPQDVPAGTLTRRSLADALVAVCAEARTSGRDDANETPNPTRRPELVIHVNLADLANPAGPADPADPADLTGPSDLAGPGDLAGPPNADACVPSAPPGDAARATSGSHRLARSTMRGDDLPWAGPGPRIEAGPALHRHTARRLACDARIVLSVDGPTGETLDLGRASRFPNAALTRLLWQRDGCCRYPGCDRRRQLKAHHLVHWADGGLTTACNLVLLCGTHHRALHEGSYRVHRSPSGALTFISPRGATITPAPAMTGDPQHAASAHTATITAWTATPAWHGDKLDLDHAVQSARTAWSLREQPSAHVPAGTPNPSHVPAGTPNPTRVPAGTPNPLDP